MSPRFKRTFFQHIRIKKQTFGKMPLLQVEIVKLLFT